MALRWSDVAPKRGARTRLPQALGTAAGGVYVAIIAWFDVLAAQTVMFLETPFLLSFGLAALAARSDDAVWRWLAAFFIALGIFGVVIIAALLDGERAVLAAVAALLVAHLPPLLQRGDGLRRGVVAVRTFLQLPLLFGTAALASWLVRGRPAPAVEYDPAVLGAWALLYFGIVFVADLAGVLIAGAKQRATAEVIATRRAG